MHFAEDFALALQLQEQFANELKPENVIDLHTHRMLDMKNKENGYRKKCRSECSLVDPSWEYIDPTPDIHALFTQFDNRFFWGKLKGVEVRWSPKMTSCAGICCYEGRGGLCSVRLSLPLLKLRPRKDLVETLLHEMIHAFLFVTHNNRDRDGHGPEFHDHMYRINKEAGTNITVYHSFHQEVKLYQQHWWRCNGPCQRRPPYFGMVKRAMNRAPGPTDFWWKDHQATCGGQYVKVNEPTGFAEKKAKQVSKKGVSASAGCKNDIRNFFPFLGKGNVLGSSSTNSGSVTSRTISQPSNKPQYPLLETNTNNIMGFEDLYTKNINAGASRGKQNKSDSSNSKVRTQADEQNDGLFSRSSPNKPVFGGKAHTSSSENKDKVSSGKFGGTLANRGGGTLVITAKGSNKGVSNVRTVEGNPNDGKKLIANVVPFSGKGHTLGGETTTTMNSRKSKTVSSLLVTNSAPSQVLGNGTVLDAAKANKRCGSVAGNDVHKKLKNGSPFDIMRGTEELAASKDSAVKCPVCGVEVGELYVNTHLDSCLGTAFVDDDPTVIEDCSVKSETDASKIKCPACNSEMPKCNLNAHLDICLGDVFGTASVDDNDHAEDTSSGSMKPENNAYSCPCCGMLVMHAEMNTHLDHCLMETEKCVAAVSWDKQMDVTALENTWNPVSPCIMTARKMEPRERYIGLQRDEDVLKRLNKKRKGKVYFDIKLAVSDEL